MTLHQGLAFALIGATLLLFIWGRWRYDLIALGSVMTGVLIGVVPAANAFDGFKSDVVVIIAAALVVSAAFERSGIVEVVLRPLLSRLKGEQSQVPALAAATALLSMASKNVGALAILMPVAQQLSRRTGTPISRLLMPMSFASLLGGLVTLVGTSTNIIVSQVREQTLGKPFGMYDFAPVGLGLTALGLVFLAFAYRILPKDRPAQTPLSQALASQSYVTEAVIPDDWSAGPKRVGEIRDASGGAKVTAILRGDNKRLEPHANTLVKAGDVLQLEGETDALHKLIADLGWAPHRADRPLERSKEEVRSVEAVVGADSPLTGRSVTRVDLQGRFNVKLLAVARSGRRVNQRLRTAPIRAGDILVLRGSETDLSKALTDLGALPLADRAVQLGSRRPLVLPAVILAAAMVCVAVKLLPVAIAFMIAAVAMVATRAISMREAYASLDGTVLVLIAALTPVSEALQKSGGADIIAANLSLVLLHAPPLAVLGLMMLAAMVCAPFMHNAPTVLILAPVAIGVARHLHLGPDPLLMAVATGAACDFLTPVGHQCNTLVLGPGGYRFSDYTRLGAPLSLLVIVVGTLLISVVWPLGGR
ncbi:MAG TPA: SLC13 family permease [Caulobacteraceae bacterium]|jgi:di/tricarboxylate transporter|nr:SLC13 family permease [Caulobacteraceae bacterium]